ncbi:UNVERIFIED_ORG: hypothetical protein J2Y77_000664 [Pseudomonas lini]|uniref:Uncharacterized protein n=1 Tax=Pseudomonas viciae TaxID=2505979 RepID=A0A4V1CAF8_9PSED|nr:hypothetical protein [Pseudomonas viciae]QBZ88754.1 hypothetical protein EPZ47_08525 [Pseudomonas viciae]UZE88100.1 hypothetical protein LOY66_08435 [Pseudomonas viciae]WGO95080.1 hypothetical protein QCD61_08345 [Pseudomonas viciae]
MNTEHVLLAGGRVIPFSDIRSRYSLSIFQTELFYTVCEYMAKQAGARDVAYKVLANLYALKSSRVKDLVSLLYFLKEEGHSCIQIRGYEDAVNLLDEFHHEIMPRVVSLGSNHIPYLARSTTLFIVLKIALHRLFRIFSGRSIGATSIVRGWVEVTDSMYKDRLASSVLLLYPFPYGIARQFRFFRTCKKSGLRVRLAGLPYSWRHLSGLLFHPCDSALRVVEAEVQAYVDYADELLAQGVRTVYTSDEFEVASVALYERLIANGVKVVNTAHGVGLYAPFVAYSEFRGVNFAQADFYRRRCPDLTPVVREGKNTQLALARAEDALDLPPAVVLLDQNFLDFQCLAEDRALKSTYETLETLCARDGLPLFVKIHPNSKDDSASKASGSVRRVRRWEDINGVRPIFVTVNSTAFYDVQGHGPILICDERSFFPEIYFGERLMTYTLDNLELSIEKLVDSANWMAAARLHEQRGR